MFDAVAPSIGTDGVKLEPVVVVGNWWSASGLLPWVVAHIPVGATG
jgi:hypothetical protein